MYSLQRRYGHHFRKKGLAEMEFPDSSFFFDGCVSDCFSTVALKQFFRYPYINLHILEYYILQKDFQASLQ